MLFESLKVFPSILKRKCFWQYFEFFSYFQRNELLRKTNQQLEVFFHYNPFLESWNDLSNVYQQKYSVFGPNKWNFSAQVVVLCAYKNRCIGSWHFFTVSGKTFSMYVFSMTLFFKLVRDLKRLVSYSFNIRSSLLEGLFHLFSESALFGLINLVFKDLSSFNFRYRKCVLMI